MNNAMMIFECFGDSGGLLEFEYINEEGTGLGPTLEYYTLVIDDIRKLPIWRRTTNNTLFPEPILHFNSPTK
jgi:E3 ubiquitin-protein ligase TRIP12